MSKVNANAEGLTVVHPAPHGAEDFYHTAERLVNDSRARFGGLLGLEGGEVSSTALTSDIPVVLTSKSLEAVSSPLFGIMSMLPFLRNSTRPLGVVNKEIVEHSFDSFLANLSPNGRCDTFLFPFDADS